MSDLASNLDLILENECMLAQMQKRRLTLAWLEGLAIGLMGGALIMAIVASLIKC